MWHRGSIQLKLDVNFRYKNCALSCFHFTNFPEIFVLYIIGAEYLLDLPIMENGSSKINYAM